LLEPRVGNSFREEQNLIAQHRGAAKASHTQPSRIGGQAAARGIISATLRSIETCCGLTPGSVLELAEARSHAQSLIQLNVRDPGAPDYTVETTLRQIRRWIATQCRKCDAHAKPELPVSGDLLSHSIPILQELQERTAENEAGRSSGDFGRNVKKPIRLQLAERQKHPAARGWTRSPRMTLPTSEPMAGL
jgi:hypothetical protein